MYLERPAAQNNENLAATIAMQAQHLTGTVGPRANLSQPSGGLHWNHPCQRNQNRPSPPTAKRNQTTDRRNRNRPRRRNHRRNRHRNRNHPRWRNRRRNRHRNRPCGGHLAESTAESEPLCTTLHLQHTLTCKKKAAESESESESEPPLGQSESISTVLRALS